MRVNSKIVIDLASGEIIHRESEDYFGPLSLAGPIAPFLPFISAGFSILGGLSGMAAGNQNAANAKAEGRLAQANAAEEASRVRRQVAVQQSSLRARAQGDLSGSPMEVYLENAKQGELEAQDKLFAGQLTALAKKREAAEYKRQGNAALGKGLFEGFGNFMKTGVGKSLGAKLGIE